MADEKTLPLFQLFAGRHSLTVMMHFRFPLWLRQVEDLLHERAIDICHERVRFWWNRFGPLFAAEIRRRGAGGLGAVPQWRWHLDEIFVKINGETHYLWRAVDHEGEVLEVPVTAVAGKARFLPGRDGADLAQTDEFAMVA